jgi:hypothetical protein
MLIKIQTEQHTGFNCAVEFIIASGAHFRAKLSALAGPPASRKSFVFG